MQKMKILLLFILISGSVFAEKSNVLERANQFVQQGRYEKAINLLQGVIKQHKDYYEAYYLLGKSYYKLEDYATAEDYIKKSISLKPELLPNYIILGNIYIKKQHYKQAEKIFLKGIGIKEAGLFYERLGKIKELTHQTNTAEEYYLKAYAVESNLSYAKEVLSLCMARKDYDKVVSIIKHSGISTQNKEIRDIAKQAQFNQLIQKAEKKFRQHKYKEALSLFKQAQKYKDTLKVSEKIGYCYYYLKKEKEAEKIVRDLIKKESRGGYRLLAKILMNQKTYQEARNIVEEGLKKIDNDSVLYRYGGELSEYFHNYDKAIRYYQYVILMDKKEPDIYYRLGVLQFNKKAYKEGLNNLEISYQMNPNRKTEKILKKARQYYFLEQGNLYFEEKKYKKAVEMYKRSLQIQSDVITEINLANSYIELKEHVPAKKLLKKIIKKTPDFIVAYESLSYVYEKEGKIQEAEKLRKKMEKKSKNNWKVYYASGEFYEQNEKYKKAIEKYKQAKKIKKKDTERIDERIKLCYYNYGVSLYNQKKFKEAKQQILMAKKLSEADYPQADYVLKKIENVSKVKEFNDLISQGKQYFYDKKFKKAISVYKRILDLRDDINTIKYNLSECYYNTKEYFKARLLVNEILLKDPHNLDAQLLLAKIEIQDKKYEEAERILNNILEYDKRNVEVYSLLAKLKEKKNKIKEALSYYRKAIKLDKENFDIIIDFGNLLYKNKEYTKAQEVYEYIYQYQPNNDIVLYNLGIIYFKKNRLEDARRKFEKAKTLIRSYPLLYFNLAKTSYYLGEYDASLEYAMRARAMANNIIYKWGMANIYTMLSKQEKNNKKAEEYEKKAKKLYMSCIYNNTSKKISEMARGKVLEVLENKLFLYETTYQKKQTYSPRNFSKLIYIYDEDKNVLRKYQKTRQNNLWTKTLPSRPSGQFEVGEYVYVPTKKNILLLSRDNGEIVRKLAITGEKLYPLGKYLFVVDSGGKKITGFSDKKKMWSYKIPNGVLQTIDLNNGEVFISYKKGVSKLDVQTGKVFFESLFQVPVKSIEKISFSEHFLVCEVVDEKNKRQILKVDSATGEKEWSKILRTPVSQDFIVDVDTILCPFKNKVLALGVNGKTKWQKTIKENVSDVMVKGNTLFIATAKQNIYGYNVETGKQKFVYSVKKGVNYDNYCFLYYIDE